MKELEFAGMQYKKDEYNDWVYTIIGADDWSDIYRDEREVTTAMLDEIVTLRERVEELEKPANLKTANAKDLQGNKIDGYWKDDIPYWVRHRLE
jgi:hypothetical protein